ncbi:retinoid-inducible serine carboxypeptidase-like isoform X2 [Microplitis mediator]|uniref:retinoid-inducible serine carboxypeptidase-like isoform X2 n=1 Tax=Microplitis mediator TaxID=375433 RepID=UPI0025553E6A|nr:retinoid-inducible serine carboxypeptidase-like isoform X2 [Microplitis mediator]
MPWVWITIFISSLFACDKVNKVEGKKGFGPGEQDWGYVTVRPGAHMFWWLYYVNPPDKPTNFDPLSKPLIIWIHGGPGGSGTGYGNFKQFGPLDIHGHYRNYTWAQKSKSIQSDLKGIVLGAPWISPIDSILSWPPFLLNTGIVNSAGYEKIKEETEKVGKAIEAKKWREATDAKNEALKIVNEVSDYIPTSDILIEKKSYDGVQNYTTRFPKPQKPDENLAELIHFMNNDVKKTLGLISPWVLNPPEVVENIYEDIMKPVVNIVEELLNETDLKVSVYAGQLDLFVALPGTVKWVENLKWKHEDAWKRAPRVAFAVDNIIEGYVQAYDKLKMYWVLRAGHLVVEDNPHAVNAILQEITSVKYNP